jgi:hypothetical protein
MSGTEEESGLRAAVSVRLRFLWDVLPTGLVPVVAIGGFVTLFVGGSVLDLFQVDPWFGVLVVVVAIALGAFQGTFQKWQDAVAIAEAGGPLPAALPEVLADLIRQGEGLCKRLEEDESWGVIHHESGLSGWMVTTTNLLNAEVPELAIWFHQMNSPSRRLGSPPSDPKKGALAQFRWLIDRLADIADMVRARGETGHPDGREATDRLLLLDRCLKLFQESDLLKRRLPAGLSMFPGYLEADQADKLIADCNERLRVVLVEAVGPQGAEDLVDLVAVDNSWTIRDDVDKPEANLFMRRNQALRDALRLDELTIRP